MNNALIENVARAICISQGGNPDSKCTDAELQKGPRNTKIIYPKSLVPMWQLYINDAKAAIQVFRDLTPEQLGKQFPDMPWPTFIRNWQEFIDNTQAAH